MSLFGKDEVQDLLNVLSKLGYKKSDFDLTPHENKPVVVGVSPILGNVSIKRNSNNCTYFEKKNRVFIKATRNIKAGSEIFVSYGRSYWNVMREELGLKKK